MIVNLLCSAKAPRGIDPLIWVGGGRVIYDDAPWNERINGG
jgi:hypothetical protein